MESVGRGRRPIALFEDRRHPLVQFSHHRVGVDGDDRERARYRVVRLLEFLL
jgi:hypothetical protein